MCYTTRTLHGSTMLGPSLSIIYLSIRLGTWVEQQLAKLESDAATKASLKASSGQRRASTASTTP